MKPIIIGGHPRSGTTILRKTVGKQLGIMDVPIETHLFSSPVGFIGLVNLLSTGYEIGNMAHIDRVIAALQAMLRHSNLRDPKCLLSDFHKSTICANFVGRGFLRGHRVRIPIAMTEEDAYTAVGHLSAKIFESQPAALNCSMWVEKTPWNVLLFPQIAKLLPQAALIHIRRDPRDVIDSIMTKFGPYNIIGAIQRYEQWLIRWEQVVDDTRSLQNYVEVQYEHLAGCQGPAYKARALQTIATTTGLSDITGTRILPLHVGRHKSWPKNVRAQYRRLRPRLDACGLL